MTVDLDRQLTTGGTARRFATAVVSAAVLGLATEYAPGLSSGGIPTQPTTSGVVVALAFGAIWGVTRAVGATRRMRALGSLTTDERREVLHAVEAGAAPEDPTLATAVLVRAEQVRAANVAQPLARVVALAALQLGLVAVAAVSHQPVVVAAQAVVLGLWQRGLRTRRRDRERLITSALLADRRARAELGLAPDPDRWREKPRDWTNALLVTVLLSTPATLAALIDGGQHAVRPPTVEDLRAAGYVAVGSRDGTDIWLHVDSSNTLQLRTTGAASDSCSLALGTAQERYEVSSPQSVCSIRHTGPVVAYLTDNTYRRMTADFGNGTTLSQDAPFRLTHRLAGDYLFVVAAPGQDGYPSVGWD